MSALSDRLNEARGDRSVREIGRAAKKVNGTGESTVIPYFNGKHGTPSLPVLAALADVLDVPLSELRIAAGLPAGERLPYKPPAEADLLSRSQRTALDALIKSIVESRGADHDTTQPAHDTADRSPAAGASGETREGEKTARVVHIKRDSLNDTESSPETEPEPLPEERPEDAWAARKRDPRFKPDIPSSDNIGEESQDPDDHDEK